jgi:hypothetical protein
MLINIGQAQSSNSFPPRNQDVRRQYSKESPGEGGGERRQIGAAKKGSSTGVSATAMSQSWQDALLLPGQSPQLSSPLLDPTHFSPLAKTSLGILPLSWTRTRRSLANMMSNNKILAACKEIGRGFKKKPQHLRLKLPVNGWNCIAIEDCHLCSRAKVGIMFTFCHCAPDDA